MHSTCNKNKEYIDYFKLIIFVLQDLNYRLNLLINLWIDFNHLEFINQLISTMIVEFILMEHHQHH
jgi:hypothetical protein